ncbi:hypothetical protein [Roseobacter sp.]|uniref:hypothetical protein n=1 Tax=Roseobacter sp. TaxID=1907202 RepID=UPI00385C50D0
MFYGKNHPLKIAESGPGLTEGDVDQLVHLLNELPTNERSSRAMKIASRLLEYAAFELAGRQPAAFVAELVDASAKIENSSSEVMDEPTMRKHRVAHRLQ